MAWLPCFGGSFDALSVDMFSNVRSSFSHPSHWHTQRFVPLSSQLYGYPSVVVKFPIQTMGPPRTTLSPEVLRVTNLLLWLMRPPSMLFLYHMKSTYPETSLLPDKAGHRSQFLGSPGQHSVVRGCLLLWVARAEAGARTLVLVHHLRPAELAEGTEVSARAGGEPMRRHRC